MWMDGMDPLLLGMFLTFSPFTVFTIFIFHTHRAENQSTREEKHARIDRDRVCEVDRTASNSTWVIARTDHLIILQ